MKIALLLKEINLNKKAILDLREYYVAPDSYSKNKVMLCKYGVWRYKNDLLLDVLKNIVIKLKENENIGIAIADYNIINFIKKQL